MESKWFVYLEDHHEGPFTVKEIQEKTFPGVPHSGLFVWKEGMEDWKLISEVAEFQPVMPMRPVKQESRQSWEDLPLHGIPVEADPQLARVGAQKKTQGRKLNHTPENQAQIHEKGTGKKKRSWVGVLSIGVILGAGVYAVSKQPRLKDFPWMNRVTGLGSGVTSWVLQKGTYVVPVVDQFFSSIPKLEDLSKDELEELRAVARASLKSQGAQFAVVVSRANPLSPAFYASSNLEDGTRLRIIVVGISETLLNQLSFEGRTEVVIKKKWGKSGLLQIPEENSLTRGEYGVYLVLDESQPEAIRPWTEKVSSSLSDVPFEVPKGAKVVGYKRVFLGGQNDESYYSQLKEYHEKLRARATGELNESKHFYESLNTQFDATRHQFEIFQKSKNQSRQKKSWERFHTEWNQKQTGLEQIFQKWTPELLSSEYFYGSLYELTQEISQAISRVHDIQNTLILGVQGEKLTQSELKQAESSVEEALQTLKAKIELAERLPPTERGLPQREGI